MIMIARFPSLRLVIISLSMLFVAGCASSTRSGAVAGDRSQLMLTDSASLNAEATQAYAELLDDARQKKALNTDPKLLARARTIMNRIAPQTAFFRPDAPHWDWEVNVIKSDDLNAFCYPGGKMIVLSGIVTQLELTDDELAAIMGHEITHALREHSREQQSQGLLVSLLAAFARTKIGNIADYAGQVYMLSNSRTAETEADRIGIELMARAGYNPNAAVTLWEKMYQASGSRSGISWLSTHPSPTDRINVLKQDTQTVWPLYEAAKAEQAKNPQVTKSAATRPVRQTRTINRR